MKLTENFSLKEFQCKSGADTPLEVLNNIKILSNQLQVLRTHLNKPVSITSGYRSPAHNKKIGGAKASKHTLGQAADFKVKGMTPKQVIEVIEQLISDGKMFQGGIGIYSTWVHYDIRGNKARW